MSEKKPDVKGKASYKSKGERNSGGRVPKINTNLLESALGLNITFFGTTAKRSTLAGL